MTLQTIQTISSPGFSWTITASGLMICATIVGATATIIKTMIWVCRPLVKSWSEMQESIAQTKENTLMIKELKLSNEKLTTLVESLVEDVKAQKKFMQTNLGKRLARETS